MITIDLIFDEGCPNVDAARRCISAARDRAGGDAHVNEWERGSPAMPPAMLAYGSPTILVNGKDVSDDGVRGDASCCRLYPTSSGAFEGTPGVEMVAHAISAAMQPVRASNEVNGDEAMFHPAEGLR